MAASHKMFLNMLECEVLQALLKDELLSNRLSLKMKEHHSSRLSVIYTCPKSLRGIYSYLLQPSSCHSDDSDDQRKFGLRHKLSRQVKQYEGLNPSKENPDYDIMKRVKQMGRLVSNNSIKHKVPFCPRSNTPLIYKVISSTYHRTTPLQVIRVPQPAV